MTATEATAEVFWTAFRSLSKSQKEAVMEKMFMDKQLREDLIDIAILEQRRHESSRPLQEILKGNNRRKKG